MQQPSRMSAPGAVPDKGVSPLLTRILARRDPVDEREDLTQAFLSLLGIGEVDGAQVAQALRASFVGSAAADASWGLQSRLGATRGRSNGYTVARRLRKQLKEQSTPAA